MKIDAQKQTQLLEAINLVRNFIEEMEPQKSCGSCLYWDGQCGLYKEIPPSDIITNGCPDWAAQDEIPF